MSWVFPVWDPAVHSIVSGLEEKQGWGLAGEGSHWDLCLDWVFLIHLSKTDNIREEGNILDGTAKWFLQILVHFMYSAKTFSKQKASIQNLQTLYLQDYGNLN